MTTQTVKPMPYYEAKQFAKKFNLVMKAIENDEEEGGGIYFQMDNNTPIFFTKSKSGEIHPIDEDIQDYLSEFWEYYYKPVGRAK